MSCGTRTLVSVTGGIQPKVTHSTGEYRALLREFAAGIEAAHPGTEIATLVHDVPDPAVQVDGVLIRTAGDIGADLVVMGSHRPGWAEYLVNSHGGRVASHAPVSVFVVRAPA
jgi:nucleotide-binding universal stress UspA family protein